MSHSGSTRLWRSLALSIQFLTRIPVSVAGEVQECELAGAMCWFPLVGGALGVTAAALATSAAIYVPAPVAATLAMIFLTMVTGNLHLDGLMDTADGIYGGYTPQRRLEIMRDSRAGAHGVVAAGLALLLKWSLLVSLLHSARLWWALPTALASGRWSLVLAARSQPPARPGGLGQLYARHLRPRHLAWATVVWLATLAVSAGLASPWSEGDYPAGPSRLPLVLLAGPAGTLGFGRYVRGKIGGLTGDTLGATNELVEMIVLLLIAVGGA